MVGRRYEDQRTYTASVEELWDRLPGALEAAGFRITSTDEATRTVNARKRRDAIATGAVGAPVGDAVARGEARKTFGELMTVTLRPWDAGCTVWMESKLRFGLIDWGENRKNCMRLIEVLNGRP